MLHKILPMCCGIKCMYSSVFSTQVKIVQRRYSSHYASTEYKNFLSKLLDIPKKEATLLIRKNKEILNTKLENVRKSSSVLLNDFGFSKEDVINHPNVLCMPKTEIKNRFMFLEECGFLKEKINASTIIHFRLCITKPIRVLKLHGLLPEDADVTSNLGKYLELNITESINPTKYESIKHVYQQVFALYMERVLNLNELEVNSEITNFGVSKCTSLRIFRENLQILQQKLHIERHKIKRYVDVVHCDTSNLLEIKSLDDLNTITAINSNPYVARSLPKDRLICSFNHLKDSGIKNEIIVKSPQIFTLNADILQERLLKLPEIPKLSIYIQHPRYLTLVLYFQAALDRINIMNNAKMQCITLNRLCSSLKLFAKFISAGVDKASINDMTEILHKSLSKSKKEIKTSLKKHLFVNYVPVTVVMENLDLLLKKGFTKNEIFVSLQLLLYPKNEIERVLLELASLNEAAIGMSQETRSLRNEYLLPLVLYFLERENRFSCTGVWMEKKQSQHTEDEFDFQTLDIEELEDDLPPSEMRC